jgi:hypothetical protein
MIINRPPRYRELADTLQEDPREVSMAGEADHRREIRIGSFRSQIELKTLVATRD